MSYISLGIIIAVILFLVVPNIRIVNQNTVQVIEFLGNTAGS